MKSIQTEKAQQRAEIELQEETETGWCVCVAGARGRHVRGCVCACEGREFMKGKQKEGEFCM